MGAVLLLGENLPSGMGFSILMPFTETFLLTKILPQFHPLTTS